MMHLRATQYWHGVVACEKNLASFDITDLISVKFSAHSMPRAYPCMTFDLFEPFIYQQQLTSSTRVLRGFALAQVDQLLSAIARIQETSPFRHFVTPGGFRMSVAMTCCGTWGWISSRNGYRYSNIDPDRDCAWPAMPTIFMQLAQTAANQAGFPNFIPDTCLINRYHPGAKLALHQDKDEHDYNAPIVSLSLGISANFLFGGHRRTDPVLKIPLHHGDMIIWGGPDRLRYHGISAIKDSTHPLLGRQRINLTLRKAA